MAERLTLGLKTMQENGSLNKIFEKHFSARLKRLDLKHRKIIEVPNSQDDGSLKFLEFNALEKY